MNIETKLKFFICSIAFNGSDSFKLPNLNDIYQDHIIREEQPCALFDERSKYSCEPTPFLVSACLVKKLKRHLEPGFKSPGQRRRYQHRQRSTPKKHNPTATENIKKNTECLPKSVTILPNIERSVDIINRYKQISSTPLKNVSVLKQLLLGDDTAIHADLSSNAEIEKTCEHATYDLSFNKINQENKNLNINNDKKSSVSQNHPTYFTEKIQSLPSIDNMVANKNVSPKLSPKCSTTNASLNVTPLTMLSAENITKSLVNVGKIDDTN